MGTLECINRVELQGIVGTSRESQVGDRRIVRFSLATNYIYRNSDGCPVVETVWHSCFAFLPPQEKECGIVKGARVSLKGRLRASTYRGDDGSTRMAYEVVVKSWEVLS